MSKYLIILAAAIVIVILMVVSVSAAETKSAATNTNNQAVVTIVEGSASVYTANTRTGRPLQKGQRLAKNHEVKVGEKSRVEIRFPDGTFMRLSEGSRLALGQLEFDGKTRRTNFQVYLVIGRLWAKVKKLATPESRVDLHTQTAVVGVRGTAYNVDVKADKSALIKVYDGEVSVAGPRPRGAPAGRLIVKANQQVAVSKQGVVAEPQMFDPKADTEEWLRWNQQRDTAPENDGDDSAEAGKSIDGAAAQAPSTASATAAGASGLAATAALGAGTAAPGAGVAAAGSIVETGATAHAKAKPGAGSRSAHDLVSIIVTPSQASITSGTTESFTATAFFFDNSKKDITSSAMWKSSDTGVALIRRAGSVTGGKAGTAIITLGYRNQEVSASVTVTSPLVSESKPGEQASALSKQGKGGTVRSGFFSYTSVAAKRRRYFGNENAMIVSIAAASKIGVAGYLVSEEPDKPNSSDTRWVNFDPVREYSRNVLYTAGDGRGSKTVYVWFKDANGEMSDVKSDQVYFFNSYYVVLLFILVQGALIAL